MDITHKIALFRARHYTLNESPTSATWHWNERDWMQWIDQHGQWDRGTPSNEKHAFGHRWIEDPQTGKHKLAS